MSKTAKTAPYSIILRAAKACHGLTVTQSSAFTIDGVKHHIMGLKGNQKTLVMTEKRKCFTDFKVYETPFDVMYKEYVHLKQMSIEHRAA